LNSWLQKIDCNERKAAEYDENQPDCFTTGGERFPVGRSILNNHERVNAMRLAIIGIVTLATLCGAGQVAAADGKAVYTKSCAGCHANMAPKFGDKAAWAPRIKQGADALAASVIKGKGAMPPKGGAANDADVKAAVEYMINAAK
jgi:cytochrome c5